MILNKIKEKYPKQYDEIAWGLVVGLAAGIVAGLVGGLAWGFAWGFAWGLAAGLVGGIAAGLVSGVYPIIPFLAALLLITEILFWLDSKKIKPNANRIWFTIERKAEAALEAALILGIYPYIRYAYDNYEAIQQFIGTYGIYPLVFFGVVGLLGIWIWINSLKYRKVKKPV